MSAELVLVPEPEVTHLRHFKDGYPLVLADGPRRRVLGLVPGLRGHLPGLHRGDERMTARAAAVVLFALWCATPLVIALHH